MANFIIVGIRDPILMPNNTRFKQQQETIQCQVESYEENTQGTKERLKQLVDMIRTIVTNQTQKAN